MCDVNVDRRTSTSDDPATLFAVQPQKLASLKKNQER